jgi:circadian clock protein KaiC
VTVERFPSPLELLGTGSPALDRILGGGLPARSITLIAGEPGAGKTILALQMLFHQARQGRRSLYFTTLAEPAVKLIRYMQLFSFFDPALLDGCIDFVDLGSELRADGPDAALARVAAYVERDGPDLVVIDSFKVIHDLTADPVHARTFTYDLAVHLAGWGATALLVGEYGTLDVARNPELGIADGIIVFANTRQELTAVRELEVRKLRGADYVTGRHSFDIGADGLRFYPRVRAPEGIADEHLTPGDVMTTGIAGLDEMLRGGLPSFSSTIVEGGTGTGKTLVGLRFLIEGARRGEPGLLLTLEETPAQLRWIAGAFGWDLAELEARGLLVIRHTSPVELLADRFLDLARHEIEAAGARRVVLDSLSALSLGVASTRRYRELVYALTRHIRTLGVTLLMTVEVAELMGSAQLTGRGISSIADNTILLRYVEVETRLMRVISVLKARGVNHANELYQFTIDADGPRVGPPFTELRGVLTGVPSPIRRDLDR